MKLKKRIKKTEKNKSVAISQINKRILLEKVRWKENKIKMKDNSNEEKTQVEHCLTSVIEWKLVFSVDLIEAIENNDKLKRDE